MSKIQDNGVVRDMTAEEQTEFDNHVANCKATFDAEKLTKEQQDNLKASAKAKLMSGEALTEDEANTIVL